MYLLPQSSLAVFCGSVSMSPQCRARRTHACECPDMQSWVSHFGPHPAVPSGTSNSSFQEGSPSPTKQPCRTRPYLASPHHTRTDQTSPSHDVMRPWPRRERWTPRSVHTDRTSPGASRPGLCACPRCPANSPADFHQRSRCFVNPLIAATATPETCRGA